MSQEKPAEKPTVNILGFDLIVNEDKGKSCSLCFFKDHENCTNIECIIPNGIYFTHPDGLVYDGKANTAVDASLMKESIFHCMFDGRKLLERPLGFLECRTCQKTFLPTQDADGKQSITEV